MSPAQQLYLLLLLIYLSDCLWWIPRRRWVLSGLWPEGLRAQFAGPLGNENGSFHFLFPLPGLRVAFELRERDLPGNARPEEWNATAIQARATEAIQAGRFLRVAAPLQFVNLFGLSPWLVKTYGVSFGLVAAAISILCLAVVNAALYATAHARLFPGERGERWKHTCMMVISFPMSTRGADLLTRHALGEFQAPAVVTTLASPQTNRTFLQAWSRDVRYPLQPADEGQAARDAQAARMTFWLPWWEHPDRKDWRTSDPLPKLDAGRVRCPRCLLDFPSDTEQCPDCIGVFLHSEPMS